MRIVVLTAGEPRERVVVDAVRAAFPDTAVVRPVAAPPTPPSRRRGLVRGLVGRLTWRLHRTLWERALYPAGLPPLGAAFEIPDAELRDAAGAERLRALAPDVLLTARAPLLGRPSLEVPRWGAFNVHYGIAPHYRGNDSLFWALDREDWDRVGGCVHHLSPGVDTGHVVLEVYPALGPSSGEIAVDVATTRLLAREVVRFLRAVEARGGPPAGVPQLERGRNFRSRERTLGRDLAHLARRAVGRSRPPLRGERVVRFY